MVQSEFKNCCILNIYETNFCSPTNTHFRNISYEEEDDDAVVNVSPSSCVDCFNEGIQANKFTLIPLKKSWLGWIKVKVMFPLGWIIPLQVMSQWTSNRTAWELVYCFVKNDGLSLDGIRREYENAYKRFFRKVLDSFSSKITSKYEFVEFYRQMQSVEDQVLDDFLRITYGIKSRKFGVFPREKISKKLGSRISATTNKKYQEKLIVAYGNSEGGEKLKETAQKILLGSANIFA